jgi:hypothetical protein
VEAAPSTPDALATITTALSTTSGDVVVVVGGIVVVVVVVVVDVVVDGGSVVGGAEVVVVNSEGLSMAERSRSLLHPTASAAIAPASAKGHSRRRLVAAVGVVRGMVLSLSTGAGRYKSPFAGDLAQHELLHLAAGVGR